MFGRKILFLATGYIAGNVVASMYGKGKKNVKKVQSKEDLKLMVENFLDTQKTFISDVEKKYISDENREKISEKKKEFLEYADTYTKQAQRMLEEVQKNKEVGKEKAQGFFAQALGGIRNILSLADNKIDDVEKSIKKTDKKVKNVEKEITKK